MSADFYKDWFSRERTITPLTEKERWAREMNYMRNLAESPFAQKLVDKMDVPEITEAEDAFKAALLQVDDPELRNAIDMAAGRISRAYQILGFCVGHYSQTSGARAI